MVKDILRRLARRRYPAKDAETIGVTLRTCPNCTQFFVSLGNQTSDGLVSPNPSKSESILKTMANNNIKSVVPLPDSMLDFVVGDKLSDQDD